VIVLASPKTTEGNSLSSYGFHRQLKQHGLSTRQLNILFGCLFGFPALMGLFLWVQPSLSEGRDSDAPVALSAPGTIEPPKTFEDILNPSWATPREVEDFERESTFSDRFTNLRAKRLVAMLDLPKIGNDAWPADDLNSQIAYGKFAKEMNLSEEPQSFAWNVPASAGESLNGRVEVLDAGILSVGPSRVRLSGLLLPESGKTCTLISGDKADCRKAAAEQLSFYLRFRMVSCAVESQSADGEALASCQVGTSDVGEWMVRRGWALPDPASQDQRYRTAALFAQSYQLGQWRP
ncbi:MAG: hypothetical protein V4691_03635, partial [Pseudomonadota bacterium]